MIRNFLLAFYVTEWAAFDWSSKQSDTLAKLVIWFEENHSFHFWNKVAIV